MDDKCYYDDEHCHGELWQCRTCGETYCEGHYHDTDKGRNVECVACEGQRNRETVEVSAP